MYSPSESTVGVGRLEVPTISLLHHVQTGSGDHPASYPVGIRAPSLGLKWLGHEADHSPSSSIKVKNAWSYNSTPPYVCMA